MANLSGSYDPNAEASKDFGAIPTGEYTFQIVDSEVHDADGKIEIELVHEVMEGEHKGRKVWCFLKTVHPNETTMKIANSNFTAIREATGVINPRDTQELHYKPFTARVEFIPSGTVRKTYTYKRDSNEFKAWKKLEGVQPQQLSSGQTTHNTAAPAATGSVPPWKRAA